MEKKATLSRELVDLVSVVKRIVRQEIRSQSGKDALTLTQFRMLHKIKKGLRHVSKLADFFGISQPAASIMVNTMVKEGLLKRVPHPTDRRQIELHLTDQAKKKLEVGYKRSFTRLDSKLSTLSASYKNNLAKQLHEISKLLADVES